MVGAMVGRGAVTMAERAVMSLEEFKARLPIAEVVGRHVRLTRRGHDLWGCCPFHNEKTASFHVVPDKGFYHCFGCGQHGNAIDFVMAIEGVEFAQAIARLAELTGLPTPLRAEGAPAVDRTLYAANEAAARWFAGRLESATGREGVRVSAGARARSARPSIGSGSATRPTSGPPSRPPCSRRGTPRPSCRAPA